MAFKSPLRLVQADRRRRAALMRSGGAEPPPAPDWWDPDDEGLCCVAAWQAKGAASQAASYLDLVGAYDLTAPVSAPGWAAGTGWVGTGSEWLSTSAVPFTTPYGATMIVQGRLTSLATNQFLMELVNYERTTKDWAALEYYQAGNKYTEIVFDGSTSARNQFAAYAPLVDVPVNVACSYVAANERPLYVNGLGPDYLYSSKTVIGCDQINIGAHYDNAGALGSNWFVGEIWAAACYDCNLTTAQIVAVQTAMAAL